MIIFYCLCATHWAHKGQVRWLGCKSWLGITFIHPQNPLITRDTRDKSESLFTNSSIVPRQYDYTIKHNRFRQNRCVSVRAFKFGFTWHTCSFCSPIYIKLMDGTSGLLKFRHIFHLFNATIHANHETRILRLLWNYDEPFNLANKSAPTALVALYRKRKKKKILARPAPKEWCARNIFLSLPRKNELSAFNDRYLHCDTNRVLGPKHKI